MEALKLLYGTVPGRILLKVLTWPALSRAAGCFLDSGLSRPLIPLFIRKAHIDLADFEPEQYNCFNDCFTRKILPGKRVWDPDVAAFTAPCDGKLTVFQIQDGLVLPIKQSQYSVARLLGDAALADRFEGGHCFIFRLCVEDYHRYAYVASGQKEADRFLPGILHTVRPIALENVPVFTENSRSLTVLHTEDCGTMVQMEVGAMLVGRISNHEPGAGTVEKGTEKGMFLYGGSTVLVLVQKDMVQPEQRFLQASSMGEEVPVRMGERVGTMHR
ncbi:MAG: phosphatidylserine decarboxylase [Clostridiales bacterium]|nr:phosphatidylserine decarboxylase [Clostridiales bacterium]